MHDSRSASESEGNAGETRRDFLAAASTVAMAGGLIASYGTLAAMAARFLYPARPAATAWLFVSELNKLRTGDSINYTAPSGHRIVVTRLAEDSADGDFIALSSVCPHLGCMVHWEAQRQRFFCPCHNGAFDPTGQPLTGPPKQAGQTLSRFPLMSKDGLLFIEVPLPELAQADGTRTGETVA